MEVASAVVFAEWTEAEEPCRRWPEAALFRASGSVCRSSEARGWTARTGPAGLVRAGPGWSGLGGGLGGWRRGIRSPGQRPSAGFCLSAPLSRAALHLSAGPLCTSQPGRLHLSAGPLCTSQPGRSAPLSRAALHLSAGPLCTSQPGRSAPLSRAALHLSAGPLCTSQPGCSAPLSRAACTSQPGRSAPLSRTALHLSAVPLCTSQPGRSAPLSRTALHLSAGPLCTWQTSLRQATSNETGIEVKRLTWSLSHDIQLKKYTIVLCS